MMMIYAPYLCLFLACLALLVACLLVIALVSAGMALERRRAANKRQTQVRFREDEIDRMADQLYANRPDIVRLALEFVKRIAPDAFPRLNERVKALQAADSITEQLLQMPRVDRAAYLIKLEQENPPVHAMVCKYLEEDRRGVWAAERGSCKLWESYTKAGVPWKE